MRKLSTIAFIVISISIMSCSSTNFRERVELVELEREGYSMQLDSSPIKLRLTYLNETNISEVKIDKKRRYVNILRKDTNSKFHSVNDLLNQEKYDTTIDLITVDGLVLDSVMIQKVKFEDGAV